jgi:uncharacterized protein
MNMRSYKTPGVYVEEVSTLPPSVAEVSTAIPAFLGYTEKGPLFARVSSMLEFTELFGGAKPTRFKVTASRTTNSQTGEIKTTAIKADPDGTNGFVPEWLLYYAVSHYFKNGGGPCYVFKVDEFKEADSVDKNKYTKALELLEQVDEPTLIVLTDAIKSKDSSDYYDIANGALAQCQKLTDRFLILDVLTSDLSAQQDMAAFRDKVTGDLAYAAAYYPYLRTSLSPDFDEKEVSIIAENINAISCGKHDGLIFSFQGPERPQPTINVTSGAALKIDSKPADSILTIDVPSAGATAAAVLDAWKKLPAKPPGFTIEANPADPKDIRITPGGAEPLKGNGQPGLVLATGNGLIVSYAGPAANNPKVEFTQAASGVKTTTLKLATGTHDLQIEFPSDATASSIVQRWERDNNRSEGFIIRLDPDGRKNLKLRPNDAVTLTRGGLGATTLDALKTGNTELYNQIKDVLSRQRVILPPSAAMAGIYARVDRDRGVWKAPANVGVAAVIAASKQIVSLDLENLNVDPTAGKSINAIRDFPGKGTLVWGARTLAGNDNEWRYVSVRRLFITIEENARKASAFAVFEPNDATTWLKVRGMLESYLYSLWERGALAGPTPESAYYVHVGLGTTMTQQDVLEGRMIVEIGIAAVRPAEFIVLRFMHKLQEA